LIQIKTVQATLQKKKKTKQTQLNRNGF